MKNADTSLATAFKDAGFTVEFKMTSQMNNALQATIAENVGLIRSIPEKYFTEVEGLVMRSVARGRDLSYLTDELQKRYGITRRRAAFIAEIKITRPPPVVQSARQQALGITQGIWKHSHAGKKPRQSHVKLMAGCSTSRKECSLMASTSCQASYQIVVAPGRLSFQGFQNRIEQ